MSPRKFLVVFSGLFAVGAVTSMCSTPSSSTSGSAAAVPVFWGDFKPVVSVKELMRDMIDPIADNVFESVKIIVDKGGTVETKPKTEEDWAKVRVGATMLLEGAELLKIPRPFAPAGDLNNSTGANASELSPTQIREKVERDTVAWNARIQTLRNVGLEVLDIIKEKDAEKLWDAGENLDTACENCHIDYWYPGDKALLERLDRRLEDLYGKRADRRSLGMTPKR
jgi:hypothetical protein